MNSGFGNEKRSLTGKPKKTSGDLRPEYGFDYSKGVQGKYCRQLLQEGANVVVLDPDVARAFGDSASVNEALRSLLTITRLTRRLTKHPKRRSVQTF